MKIIYSENKMWENIKKWKKSEIGIEIIFLKFIIIYFLK